MSDQAIVRAVVGLRGYGKSTKVVQLAKMFPRVLYYDTLGDDYKDGVICRDRGVLERFWRGVYRLPFRIVYRPSDPVADFPRICELVTACGDMLFVVDEVQLYSHGPWCPPEFTKVITGGRHAGIDLIGVTQAPKKLGELLRSQAHEWFVFGVREPDQVRYLSDRLPGVPDDRFESLGKYQYVHYVDGADCYWSCLDDLYTGRTDRVPCPYATKASASGPASDSGEHADACGPLGG